jgi:uncharacterized membrane protein YuzA (DUF378 family)
MGSQMRALFGKAGWKTDPNRLSISSPRSHQVGKGDAMWFLDFTTLVLIIAAGMQLGLQAFFGWDAAATITGRWESYVFMAMGVSAVWQVFRQKFQ